MGNAGWELVCRISWLGWVVGRVWEALGGMVRLGGWQGVGNAGWELVGF